MGRTIKKYGLGYCCDVSCNTELVEGLKWALSNPQVNVAGARELYEINTIEAFQSKVSDLL